MTLISHPLIIKKRIYGIWISRETLTQHKEKLDLTLNKMHLRSNHLKNLTLKFKLCIWRLYKRYLKTLQEIYEDSVRDIWRLYEKISEDSNSVDFDHDHVTVTHAQKHTIKYHMIRNLSWKYSNCSIIIFKETIDYVPRLLWKGQEI